MASATPGGSRARARRAPLCPRARVRVGESREKEISAFFFLGALLRPALTADDTLTCTSETQSRRINAPNENVLGAIDAGRSPSRLFVEKSLRGEKTRPEKRERADFPSHEKYYW